MRQPWLFYPDGAEISGFLLTFAEMKTLKRIRIGLEAAFLLCTTAYFLTAGHAAGSQGAAAAQTAGQVAFKSQIITSSIAVSVGAILFWLVITFVYGRIYCSSVCPVGALIDLLRPLRRIIPQSKSIYRYRKPSRLRYHILIVYIICLIAGLTVVPLLIEPWNIYGNIVGAAAPSARQGVWIELGLGAATGILAGIVSFLLVLVCAVFTGREFCNSYCPLGILLTFGSIQSVYHIEIDPDKCIGCTLCEESCPSGCIKAISHYVDDSRCVRCFDCLAACPNNAIRYQPNRNRPATPLMKRVKRQA